MCTLVQREAAVEMLAASDPEAPPETWRSYRQILQEGFASIDRRLQEYGPREPERFHLEEANRRLAQREDFMGRSWPWRPWASRRPGDSAWHTGLCGRPTSDPRSEAEARGSERQPAVSQPGRWYAYGQDGVRSGRGAQPERGAWPMPKRGAADIPSDHGLATRGAHQSRDALSGNPVGLPDCIRESGRLVERSAAGGRGDPFADGPRTLACGSRRHRTGTRRRATVS